MLRAMGIASAVIIAFTGAVFAQNCDPQKPHIWSSLSPEQISERGLGEKAISVGEAFIAASKSVSRGDVSLVLTDCPFDGYPVRTRHVFKGVPAMNIRTRFAVYISEKTLRSGSSIDLARIVRKEICLIKTGVVTEAARGIDIETPPVTRCMIDFATENEDYDYGGWLTTKLAMSGYDIDTSTPKSSDLDQKIKTLEGMPNAPPGAIDALKKLRDSLPRK